MLKRRKAGKHHALRAFTFRPSRHILLLFRNFVWSASSSCGDDLEDHCTQLTSHGLHSVAFMHAISRIYGKTHGTSELVS